MLHVVTQKEFVKVTIKLLDRFLKLAKEQSKKHGEIANQLTVIFDMEGFNLKQYIWRPGKIFQVKPEMMLRKFFGAKFFIIFYCIKNFVLYSSYHSPLL